ncbi:MAG: AAA family ATPase [bacterium]
MNHSRGEWGDFVGRERDIERLNAALETSPLVTLTGIGGVGKTRLAIEVTSKRTNQDTFEVWLDQISEPQNLVPHVLAALGLPPAGQDDIARIQEFLSERQQPLLLLDNAEHLLDAVREFVAYVGNHATILVTSQVALDQPRELVVPIAELSQQDAIALFHTRIGGPSAPGDVDALVTALEGLPLAIELAASRTLVLSPTQILTRLETSNKVLGSSSTARHGTLDRTMYWSWGLLDPGAREVMAALSLFDHPLDPALLEALLPDVDVLEAARELTQRAWLRVSDGPDRKWSTLWAVRRFVREHTEAALHAVLTDRLTDWALAHAHEAPGWWAFYIPEGIRAARALTQAGRLADAARLLNRLFFGAFGGTSFRDVLDLAADVLNAITPDACGGETWALLATKLSKGAFRYRSAHRPIVWSAAALEAAPAGTVARLGAMAQHVICLVDDGLRDEANQRLAELAVLRDHTPDDMRVASALLDAASAMHEMGQFGELRLTCERLLHIARSAGNIDAEARAWIHLSYASYDLGEFERAGVEVSNLERLLSQRHPHERIALGGAVSPLVQIQAGNYEEARVALDERMHVARASRDTALTFFVQLARAELAARTAPETVRGFLEDALSQATGGSQKSTTHARVLLVIDAIVMRQTDTALQGLRTIREEGFTPTNPEIWSEVLDALEWVASPQGSAPQTPFGEIVSAAASGVAAVEEVISRYPSRQWCIPGLYFLRFDQSARRIASNRTGAVLRLDREGREFQVNQEAKVDLSRRQAMRRILVYLAQQHACGRTTSITVDELVDAGWPGEKIVYDAALTRVYTTINRLRTLGINELLLTRDDGYALTPDVLIEWTD